jgi:hypothetical protein
VRRLVVTQRDWERLWGWVNGRLPQREPVAEPDRSAQLSQLLAAKQRAVGEKGEPVAGVEKGGGKRPFLLQHPRHLSQILPSPLNLAPSLPASWKSGASSPKTPRNLQLR